MASDADGIIAFFRQHSDQRFCSTCLAVEFRLTFQGVDDELATVGQTAALTEFLGQCAICGRLALVTGLERRSARSPAERVLHFVLDHVGRFFCHVCIARSLRLNIGTTQKAVSHLRASSEVRIADMACSGCGRRRLVLGCGRVPPRLPPAEREEEFRDAEALARLLPQGARSEIVTVLLTMVNALRR